MRSDKTTIRELMKQKRQDLDEPAFLLYSRAIYNTLVHLPVFVQADCIGIYISTDHEVDTRQLISDYVKEKQICVPKVHGRTMDFYHINDLNETKPGVFGILEPVTDERVTPEKIDLMIVPLLAYDHAGNRIGYGGGYYDRYLSDVHCPAIALAFSFQEMAAIAPEVHDQPLTALINEKGLISF